jgi:hypothetical protein
MTGFQIFEAIGGLILGYVGVRFIVARRIPIVSEGGFEPLAWITGWEGSHCRLPHCLPRDSLVGGVVWACCAAIDGTRSFAIPRALAPGV